MSSAKYIGDELSIFKHAVNWKKYWLDSVGRYLTGDVLEVGAGMGVNTNLLLTHYPGVDSIVCVEPDPSLASQIMGNLTEHRGKVTVLNGYLNDLDADPAFDVILYIDVIEHIEDDAGELELAASRLKPGGVLIILVPAYNFLFSPFDEAVGHYRRYDKRMLRAAVPTRLEGLELFYLDSLGVCASLMNKFVLKQPYPTETQILRFDRLVIPVSRITDKLLFHAFGKSLVGVWKK